MKRSPHFLSHAFRFLSAIVGFALSCTAVRADWPMHRGNPQLQGQTDAAAPAAVKLVWSFKAPKPVKGAAAIAARRVFFGDDGGVIHALQLGDGRGLFVDIGARNGVLAQQKLIARELGLRVVLLGGPGRTLSLGPVHARVRRLPVGHQHGVGPVVRGPGRPQMDRPGRRRRRRHGRDPVAGPEIPRGDQRTAGAVGRGEAAAVG